MSNLTHEQQEDLLAAAHAAVAAGLKTGFPARLAVAQWAEESGWGRYQPGCNCFGIKAYHGCYGTQTLFTHEYIHEHLKAVNQVFATFPNLQACFDFHGKLITEAETYRQAWVDYLRTQDQELLIRDVAVHYAPGNMNYAPHIINLLRDPNIISAVAIAQQVAAEKLQAEAKPDQPDQPEQPEPEPKVEA